MLASTSPLDRNPLNRTTEHGISQEKSGAPFTIRRPLSVASAVDLCRTAFEQWGDSHSVSRQIQQDRDRLELWARQNGAHRGKDSLDQKLEYSAQLRDVVVDCLERVHDSLIQISKSARLSHKLFELPDSRSPITAPDPPGAGLDLDLSDRELSLTTINRYINQLCEGISYSMGSLENLTEVLGNPMPIDRYNKTTMADQDAVADPVPLPEAPHLHHLPRVITCPTSPKGTLGARSPIATPVDPESLLASQIDSVENTASVEAGKDLPPASVITDINNAVRVLKEAVRATTIRGPERARYLYNLRFELTERFKHTRAIADLDEAILVAREAEEAAEIDGYIWRGWHLDKPQIGPDNRFSRIRTKPDIDEAILLAEKEVKDTPVSSPDRAYRLNNLGVLFGERCLYYWANMRRSQSCRERI